MFHEPIRRVLMSTYLCLALSIFLCSSCDMGRKEANEIQGDKRVLCRIVGSRIFDVQQTPEEAEAHIVTSYRIISEHITVYNDRSCQWTFSYTDDERVHAFEETLPKSVFTSLQSSLNNNVFASLQNSLKYESKFKVKDGIPELTYDLCDSSITSPKGVGETLGFLTEKYEESRR